ncbi:hypothetical protein F5X99DRAFT_236176 [Biscogniauxia marginata]|nr:hypothetical protein F5X99DRAFT_236176 [Biscogniauxia marginata]
MFACKACLRGVLNIFIDHALSLPQAASLTTLRPLITAAKPRRSRQYATATATATATRSGSATKTAILQRGAGGYRRSKLSPVEWAAQKHLQYLKDPLHIAEYVKRAISNGQFEEALLVTKKASRNTKVTVSWNHLIDYQLRHDRIHAAFRLYNDMKKHAQLPNAQTFTIIFRGCARSSHTALAVSEAVKLYHNMLSRERMQPNTIHMNAVLQVCAKAIDIESMFTIVQTANDGLRAPNNQTYTAILNALRAWLDDGPNKNDLTEPEKKDATAKAIQQAKAIWEEAISRWRSGAIILDEELVCAMGRLLLMGSYQDVRSVEALVEQTMMLPRDDNKRIDDDTKGARSGIQSDENTKLIVATARQNAKAPGVPATPHALPGNNSLSMILESLGKTGRTTRALRYWGIFTKNYNVVPDKENWLQLLYVFGCGKASARTVAYLEHMPAALIGPKHIRTAMENCLRDNLNRSAFHHATRVLEIMLTNFRIPDVLVLQKYLRIAFANKRHFEERSKEDLKGAVMAWGRQLTVALDNIWKPYVIVSKQCSFEDKEPLKQQVVTLARKMMSAYDRLLQENMVPRDVAKRMEATRNNLNRFIAGYAASQAKQDPSSEHEGEAEAEIKKEAVEDDSKEAELDVSNRLDYGRDQSDAAWP